MRYRTPSPSGVVLPNKLRSGLLKLGALHCDDQHRRLPQSRAELSTGHAGHGWTHVVVLAVWSGQHRNEDGADGMIAIGVRQDSWLDRIFG